MDDMGMSLDDQEKVRLASDFVMLAPPGEFHQVLKVNVQILLDNDDLVEEGAVAQHDMDQFIRAKIGGYDDEVLITVHGDLGNGRFFDPRNEISFKFDHFTKEASDPQPYKGETDLRSWRDACDSALSAYHSCNLHSVCYVLHSCVWGNNRWPTDHYCVHESHQFESQNSWNGRYRSEWKFSVTGSNPQLVGVLKIQVHCYEDENVHLISRKDIKEDMHITVTQGAKSLIKMILKTEHLYQCAILENYETSLDDAFKALRRQFPYTRTKVDWDKIVGSNLGTEMQNA
uniref:F-actin-capping protein subunit alpha n=1 Tax=Salarias fasciatus TaxID=181472 RepID=A0A672FBP2_SALFA